MSGRKVFTNDMVAHLWANRAQDEARNSGNRLYFKGPTLYSFGSHFVIGHWLPDGRLLWNDASYSIRTSQQQSLARRAVARQHWDTAIHVPSLERDDLNELPGLARKCVEAAMESMEKAQKARQTRPWHLERAGRYLDSARELYKVAKQPRAARTVPALTTDADKAQVEAILVKANSSKYLAQAAEKTQQAREALGYAARATDGERGGPTFSFGGEWNVRGSMAERVMHYVEAARKYAGHAFGLYERAKKRPSAALKAAHLEAEGLRAEYEAQAKRDQLDAQKDQARIMGETALKAWYVHRHQRKHTGEDYLSADLRWTHERLDEVLRGLENVEAPELAWVWALHFKLEKLAVASRLCARIDDLAASMRETVPHAAGRGYYDAPNVIKRRAHELSRVATPAAATFAPRLVQRAEALILEADKQIAEWEAGAAERNAEAIAAWRRGESVRLPSEVPTMARIKGDIVETSMGAEVPLDHACRLARIARRVMAQGGRSWQDGEGPRVGHFQVQSIGADGSAVIGCHEFSALEGSRILRELEACEACSELGAA